MPPPRCRVTFFDIVHQTRRTLEIDAALPLVAAEIALKRLERNHVPIEDLAPTVKVEVITAKEVMLPLRVIHRRQDLRVEETKVA